MPESMINRRVVGLTDKSPVKPVPSAESIDNEITESDVGVEKKAAALYFETKVLPVLNELESLVSERATDKKDELTNLVSRLRYLYNTHDHAVVYNPVFFEKVRSMKKTLIMYLTRYPGEIQKLMEQHNSDYADVESCVFNPDVHFQSELSDDVWRHAILSRRKGRSMLE
jgi:hypothetical protein